MADTSVYTVAKLSEMKASNDDYLANKAMYRELNIIKILVLGHNNLYGSSNYAVYTYTSVANKDYFASLLQKLQAMFPDSFIYYTRGSNSQVLTFSSVRYISVSDTYATSSESITNVLFISQTALTIPIPIPTEINYNDYVTIGTPLNAKYAPINNRKCWEFTGNTTITFNQNFPVNKTIYFVAVGGGQSTLNFYNGSNIPNDGNGGNGGGVVYGDFDITPNFTLTITIGSSDMPTIINGTEINIIANGGTLNGGSTSGSKIISSTIQNGGKGGNSYGMINTINYNGSNGPFIPNLDIYTAGGGATYFQENTNMYSVSNFLYNFSFGIGGQGGGGDSSNLNGNGLHNTGGGAGITITGSLIASDIFYIGWNGGSGVVYLYI
jgi:hypothetical protein